MKITKQYIASKKIEDVEFGECFLYINHIHMKIDAGLHENDLVDDDCYTNIVVDLENYELKCLANGLEVTLVEAEMTAYINRRD